MKNVLVVGGNGHLGLELTRQLVARGYKVRATVRDRSDPQRTRPLEELGVELAEADLLDPVSLRAAAEGMEGLFQVAAGFQLVSSNPERDLLEPTVTGGKNVLIAAKEAGIKRFVLTSSVAALGRAQPGDPPRDESYWNKNPNDPYPWSKALGERQALEFTTQHGIPFVSILPSVILGPGFIQPSPSVRTLVVLMRGKMPFILPFSFTYVDVRDAALAHVLAYENEQASGRYIAAGGYHSVAEVVAWAKAHISSLKAPARVYPKALLDLLPALEWLITRINGQERTLSRTFIKEYTRGENRFITDRARNELGWKARPVRDTVHDTLDWITERFL